MRCSSSWTPARTPGTRTRARHTATSPSAHRSGSGARAPWTGDVATAPAPTATDGSLARLLRASAQAPPARRHGKHHQLIAEQPVQRRRQGVALTILSSARGGVPARPGGVSDGARRSHTRVSRASFGSRLHGPGPSAGAAALRLVVRSASLLLHAGRGFTARGEGPR